MPLTHLYGVPAPAKLNLFLHVVGRRADGYHLLQSLFVLIDWADTLHFERRADGRLLRHDLGPALPADDLCLRAARALQAASGTSWGADIHIDKQLPWGAGLGGGSSDAASTLLALNRLWGLHWPRERLLQLALPLGADVPFFVAGDNAFVEGIGERLTPLAVPVLGYAVVKPPSPLATQSIFSHPALKRDTDPVILMGSQEGRDRQVQEWLASWAAPPGAGASGSGLPFGRNDLQPPAEERCPEVTQALQWLRAQCGPSRMSGSGSAVFARADVESDASAPPLARPGAAGAPGLRERLASLPPGWVGRWCLGLAQHPLRDWAG